jgi:hypothetical protein
MENEWKERLIEEQMRESRGGWKLPEEEEKRSRTSSWSMLSAASGRKDRLVSLV